MSLSTTEASRRGVCVEHQTRLGRPHKDDWVCYCPECREEHEQRCATIGNG